MRRTLSEKQANKTTPFKPHARRPGPGGVTTAARPACAPRRLKPATLSPEELDTYLEGGWYRVGQGLIFCEVVTTERGMRGVLWTRVPLAGYTYRKSLRKLMSRVERRFDVRVHPLVHDAEHEALYQRYLGSVDGDRPETLDQVRYGSGQSDGPGGVDRFDTWEVSIRDGEELVGFSWFDLGARAMQSVVGVYAPEHARYSMGVYTMLREIRHGMDIGLDHFYSGYILCGDPKMHYKLRTGHVELLDHQRGWVAEAFDPDDCDRWDPLARTRAALLAVRAQLPDGRWLMADNAHFSIGAYAPGLASCVAYPLVLLGPGSRPLVLGWDSITGRYELLRARRASLTGEGGAVLLDDLLVTTRHIQADMSLDEAVARLKGVTA